MQIPSKCAVAEDMSWGLSVPVAVALLPPLLPAYTLAVLADRVRGALCRTR